MTTLIALATIATAQVPPPTTQLTIMQTGGYGISYNTASRMDLVALVRPVGEPIINGFPGPRRDFYAEQRFRVVQSPDYNGAYLNAYYAVHGVPDDSAPYGSPEVPAKPLQLDDGLYLLVGRKQPADQIQFVRDLDRTWSDPVPVSSTAGLNATITGLFAVNGITLADNGPRWRFVMETIAASMANARGDALQHMTHQIRQLHTADPPSEPGDGGYGKRGDTQKARIVAIVRDVLARTEQSATTMEKIYYLSVLVEYDYGATEFAETVHKLVAQGMDVPDSFIWPILEEHQVVNHYPFVGFPNDLDRTKMIEIAESTIAKQAASWAFREIPTLADTSDQRRYFALIARRDHPGGRAYAYEKLIDWLDLPITLDKVDDGHGRTVRIVNEEAVRQAIATRLGIQPSMKVKGE